jgi:hypothetical protein
VGECKVLHSTPQVMAHGSGRGCFMELVACHLVSPPLLVSSPWPCVSPPHLPCLLPPFCVIIPPTIHPMSSAHEAGGRWCVIHDCGGGGSSVAGSGGIASVSSPLHLVSSPPPAVSSPPPLFLSPPPLVLSPLALVSSPLPRVSPPSPSRPPFPSAFHPPATP